MQQVIQWTDPSFPDEDRMIQAKPFGHLRTDDYAIPFYGLRNVQHGAETSNMALINAYGSPRWIHIGKLKVDPD